MSSTPPRSEEPARLSQLAKHVVVPPSAVSTGWPAVRDKLADLNISFQVWQELAARAILAKDADGIYAATVGGVGMSIPRQVGKTFLVGSLMFALCLLRPGMTVIWTAHRMSTASKTFESMQAMTQMRLIRPHVAKVTTGAGDEAIWFRNGSRILFGARERGFGRGLDEIDAVVFDEAQILTERAVDDMVPTTNQSRQPEGALLFYIGTPPKPTDPSEKFRSMRHEALSGEDLDTAWIEFGADDDYRSPDKSKPLSAKDWEQIGKANPAYPEFTDRRAILRMRKQLTAESFPREGLGLWDPDEHSGVFGEGRWAAGTAPYRPDDLVPTALAVASSIDGRRSCIAAAAEDVKTGEVWVRPLRYGKGTRWVSDHMRALASEFHAPAVIDAGGPAAHLIGELEAANVEVLAVKTGQVLDACAVIDQLVTDNLLRHPEAEPLESAVEGAVKREVRDRWAWGRRKSTTDISPLEAVTLAAWGALREPEEVEEIESVYESRGVVSV